MPWGCTNINEGSGPGGGAPERKGSIGKGGGGVRGRMEGVQPPGTERFYMYINILNVTLIKLEKCFIYSHSRRSIYLKYIDLYSLGYIRLSWSILLRCTLFTL